MLLHQQLSWLRLNDLLISVLCQKGLKLLVSELTVHLLLHMHTYLKVQVLQLRNAGELQDFLR